MEDQQVQFLFGDGDTCFQEKNHIDLETLANESHCEQNAVTGHFIPTCETEKKPYVNQVFRDLQAVFEFYKEYGRLCGFDIRRAQEKTDRLGNTTLKYYVCSRSGSSESKRRNAEDGIDSYTHRIRKTVSIKCNCPALIRVNRVENGEFVLRKFTEEHNHCFADSDGSQFLRCNRSLTDFHKQFIFDAAKLNIGATRAHGIISAMTGSHENVGATAVDFKNFSRDVKKQIGKHDADMIIQKFKDIQSSSDREFKFEFETDTTNHLTHLFWADGINRKCYEVFGDVVSFDATYRTNKYGMVFVPLVGIDNHWKSVTFAGALLHSESTESFKWLCNSLKSIFGREPRCIITDQCPAMKVAIGSVFPLVKHRLCMWHIMKKFPSKLGALFCSESPFLDKLKKFVWCDHRTPGEFEKGWNEVISEFGLSDNKWLSELYDIRQSWIPAYFNDEPMLGLLRTTSRSESSNFYFNHFVQKGDTLSEFYICYDSAIARQRHHYKKLTHYDNVIPRTISQKGIEKDAAEQYTRVMFFKIQDEILACGGDIAILDWKTVDGTKIVVLSDSQDKKTKFEVSFDIDTYDVNCSCKLFTRVGYLCRHAFFCLGINGINVIPRQYVKNRWLKKAVKRFSTLELGEISDPISGFDHRRKQLQDCWFAFQSCLSQASSDPKQISYLCESLKEISGQMQNSTKGGGQRLDAEMVGNYIGTNIVEEVTIQAPNKSNNKGCRKRLEHPAEKSTRANKQPTRECKFCEAKAFHDSRNCPVKKNLLQLEKSKKTI